MPRVTENTPAPDFTLEDLQGRPVSLSGLRGRYVLLVLNRGLNWPYAQAHLAQLRRTHDEFDARQITVLVIAREDRERVAAYWAREALPYAALPDPGGRVLRLYGQEMRILRLGRMPAQVLVDREGIVRYAHYGRSMADIPAPEAILALFDDLENRA